MYKRKNLYNKRIIRRQVSTKVASEAIGELGPGVEVFGVNKGQFSLIDILEHCLFYAGKSHVLIATWTAAAADLSFAHKLLADDRLKSLRFILDFSFPSRQPEYFCALVEKFGPHSVRLTKTHAKFATIRGDDLNFCVRSSMNLNENRRLESFEISEDPNMCDFVESLVSELWKLGDDSIYETPYELTKQFEKFGLGPDGKPTEGARYFGDGEYDRDLRRIGWSTQKGQVIV